MKVTKNKEEFTPITIEVETEEEAELLWHKLNTFSSKCKEEGQVDYILNDRMWQAFNNTYKPKCENHGRDD